MNKGHLLNPDGSPWSTGNSGYYSDYEYGNFNLLVAIKFSLGEDSANFHGLLDTGSEWVVFSKEFIESYENLKVNRV